MKQKKILSIDGGGIRGIYPASVLAEIEKDLPEPLHKYFDLIAGTSTGGIIALGIGLGFRAAQIVDFYEEYGPEIFGGNWLLKLYRHAFKIKYAQENLEKAVKETFGNRLIGESKTRLVIPSMNIQTGEVHIYKTCHREDFERDYHRPAYEAALATSSAITYFPNYINSTNDILTDGGLWANNPVLVSLMDAVGILNWNKNDIKVLSLGCIEKPFDKKLYKQKGGLRFLFSSSTEVFMEMQSTSALSASYTLLGHKEKVNERVFRINEYGNYKLDSIKELPAMKIQGIKKAAEVKSKVIPEFFSYMAEPFVPFKSV